mmetsp:Transcript_1770/g.5276  ORF Transcript_1770/g.5276 Transcript_1770/m.5276 type:complete len:245 (-) Transcript_1770:1050-1784(-)
MVPSSPPARTARKRPAAAGASRLRGRRGRSPSSPGRGLGGGRRRAGGSSRAARAWKRRPSRPAPRCARRRGTVRACQELVSDPRRRPRQHPARRRATPRKRRRGRARRASLIRVKRPQRVVHLSWPVNVPLYKPESSTPAESGSPPPSACPRRPAAQTAAGRGRGRLPCGERALRLQAAFGSADPLLRERRAPPPAPPKAAAAPPTPRRRPQRRRRPYSCSDALRRRGGSRRGCTCRRRGALAR